MNYPQQSAQGLASLGRGNDSMLVHMTPNEVQGLQGLAMARGGSLTINPQTGLPEAGILDFALPVAGAFFGIPPEFTAALMAGKTLIEGGDIGSAALSAFGGYTGGKFGQSLKSFVDPIKNIPTSAINAAANTAKTAGSFVSGQTGEMGSKLLSPSGGASQIGSNLGSVANEFGTNIPVEDAFKNSFGPDFGKSNFAPGFANNNIQGSFMGKDVGAQGMFQPGGSNTLQTTGAPTYGANVGAGTDIASTISEGASDFGNQFGAAVKNPIDFARHVGEGDAMMGGAKLGMYAASPFVEDMLKPQTFTFTDPDTGKWRGPEGQLNLSDRFDTGLRLAQGGAIASYDVGGIVGNPSVGGGLSDLYNRPEGATTQSISNDGYGIGRLNNLAGEQSRYQAQSLGYADGGGVVAGEKGMNMNELPTLNVNTGMQSNGGESGGVSDPFEGKTGLIYDMARLKDKAKPGGISYGYLSHLNNILQGKPSSFSTHASGVPYMAKGGYLDGQGDGMSDSIPATIEGKQPARLADGEFVVPADVVSHLGNGSSKAGSKRLYKMLDKVRRARTGHTKQGKQIKADKYLPA
jgi:hypothetical protein